MGKSVLPHLNCISEISVEMALNLLHLAGSSLKWLWKICLHTLVFIFKICLLRSFFFCVCNTNETNPSPNGCCPIHLVFWVANISDNRRIWGAFPGNCSISQHYIINSLTGAGTPRAAWHPAGLWKEKFTIPLMLSSAVPQFPVFPWLLSLPSWGFSHPRAQPSAEGSNRRLSRECHSPQAELQILLIFKALVLGNRLSLIKSTNTLLNCFPSD